MAKIESGLEAMMGRVIQKSESVSEFVNCGLGFFFFFFHILVLQCKTTSFCTDNLFKKKMLNDVVL